jgi:hypothetical protein
MVDQILVLSALCTVTNVIEKGIPYDDAYCCKYHRTMRRTHAGSVEIQVFLRTMWLGSGVARLFSLGYPDPSQLARQPDCIIRIDCQSVDTQIQSSTICRLL